MSGALDKANLADRTDAILRSDRQARILSDRRRQGATLLQEHPAGGHRPGGQAEPLAAQHAPAGG